MAPGQLGYNNFRTQRDHWLGWLDPMSGTGTYQRADAPGRNAKYVYNHIVEPKMLLWLIAASGVEPTLVSAAQEAADRAQAMASKAAAIRRCVPWAVVAAALSSRHRTDVNTSQRCSDGA